MRLLDRMTRRTQPSAERAVALQQMFPWEDREQIGVTLRDYTENGYYANGILYALVQARLQLFAQAEFKWQNLTTRRLFGTPELRLLESPWPNGTTGDLLARMEQDVSLAGNAFVWRPSGGSTLVRLRPDWVQVVSAEMHDLGTGAEWYEPLGYVYSEGGYGSAEARILPADEVAHWAPIPDPLYRTRGMSWVTPIVRELLSDSEMSKYRQSFFKNAATPNLLIRYQQKLSPQTVEAIRERWSARFSGASGAGATVVLDEGADVTAIGQSMEQMTFEALQAAGEDRMCSAAGVPPIVIGASKGLDAATYSNYQQALKSFANGTMSYLWQSATAALAKLVAPPTGSRLWFDTGAIPALQDAETERATASHIYAQAASVLITAGYEPASVQDALTAGDMALLAHSGLVSVQLQSPGQVPAVTPPGGQAA